MACGDEKKYKWKMQIYFDVSKNIYFYNFICLQSNERCTSKWNNVKQKRHISSTAIRL